MYNAMILPYAAGPMALSGIIFYQVRTIPSQAHHCPQYELDASFVIQISITNFVIQIS